MARLVRLFLLIPVLLSVAGCTTSQELPTPNVPATVTAQVQIELTAQAPPTPSRSLTPTNTVPAPVQDVSKLLPPTESQPVVVPTPKPTESLPPPTATPAATPTPAPTATTAATATPPPTLTRSQQLVAGVLTPEPKEAIFAKYPPVRIITVGQLQGSQRWRDGEPFLLLGCAADVDAGQGKNYFSDRGGFSRRRLSGLRLRQTGRQHYRLGLLRHAGAVRQDGKPLLLRQLY